MGNWLIPLNGFTVRVVGWLQVVKEDLLAMSNRGLRTLVIAMRVLPEEVYSEWMKIYHEATVAMRGREAKVAAACAMIEREMKFLGCTGIEDKLQVCISG